MNSVFDWITVIAFCGLAVLYLQRSSAEDPQDSVWQYLPPAIGCMGANWLGDHVSPVLGVITLVAVLAYVYYVLKPNLGFWR